MHQGLVRPVIGIGGIVFDPDDRILLIRRGTAPACGQWSLPGGRHEAGETMWEACRREILEETGLETAAGPIVAVVERRLEGFHYVIIDFLAELRSPVPAVPIPAGDVVDARWVEAVEVSGLDLVKGLAPILEVALVMRHSSERGGLWDQSGGGLDFLA